MANLVVCADGTWNRPEEDIQKDFPTNVLKLARAVTPVTNGIKQHVFYDWGLGSYHNQITAGAMGSGIHKNILDGYRYIVQNYTEGDKIYLFGFSRGAYTVRALSGLINNCGILKRVDANLINSAWKMYKSPNNNNRPNGEAAKSFREQHCYPSKKVHFIGVWDTVGALGVPFSLMGLFSQHDEFYDSKMGSNISFARHALALDEQRIDFEPTIWTNNENVNLKQVWFAGAHCDVGGSYSPDKESGQCAADIPLQWMIKEAKQAGLHLDAHLTQSLSIGPISSIHKSRNNVYRLKAPHIRKLQIEGRPTTIHPSVKIRYQQDENYRPKQLKEIVESTGWNSLDVSD